MKSTTSHLRGKLPGDFAGLNRVHPLRPINDAIELENATAVIDHLAVLDTRTRDQNDYLQTLVLLTEEFEKKENSAAMAAAARVSGGQPSACPARG